MARRYPVGEQDFKKIRDNGWLYVDKTAYVWQLAQGPDYYFLARPRRFGKSLLVSTIRYFFEGRRELFTGLAIDQLETRWESYPVLRFDMSQGKNFTVETLTNYLNDQLDENEARLGICTDRIDVSLRMKNLIQKVYHQTGKPVVVLVDEYDAPVLDSLCREDCSEGIRSLLYSFYSPLKGNAEYLRFVFLTGISKFSQLGLFSGFNNLVRITTNPDYAGICGITKTELKEQLTEDIDQLSRKMGLTPEETLEQLIENYDGYHFTWPSDDILNPFSLLSAFHEGRIKDYWFETGTSGYTVELLRKYDVLPTTAGQVEAEESDFNVPLETAMNSIPLLYQSGYLTIKAYDRRRDIYTLDIPNKEVRIGLMKCLLPHYLPSGIVPGMGVKTQDMRLALEDDNMDSALRHMKEILLMIPHTTHTDHEGHYQRLMFCFFTLAGAECRLEEHTSAGRIDIVVRTRRRIYAIELKIEQSASAAMQQIDDRDYTSYFAGYTLPVTKVGVSIDKEKRTIKDWKINE